MKTTEFEERVKKLFQQGKPVWIGTDNEEYVITGYSIIGNRVFLRWGNEIIGSPELKEGRKISANRMIYKPKE